MLITHVLHKHVQLSHSLKHIQHSCVFICQAMNLHEVCTCRGGMRISPARVCRRLSVRVRLQLRAFMTQWVLDPVIPAEGGGREPPVLLLLSTLIPINAHLLCAAPFTPIDAFAVFSFSLASVFPLHYSCETSGGGGGGAMAARGGRPLGSFLSRRPSRFHRSVDQWH